MTTDEQWPNRPLTEDERTFVRILAAIGGLLCLIAGVLSSAVYHHFGWHYALGMVLSATALYFLPRSKP